MGTDIYELIGPGHRGSPVMAHLVAIGAHDGHSRMGPYTLRKIQPNQRNQYKSWFNPTSSYVYDGHPVVGMIYFPTADTSLDNTTDRVVLDAVVAWYNFELGQLNKVELEFVGHADPRGSAASNGQLARKRAESVQRYVDNGIRRNAGPLGSLFRYRSKATSLGEDAPTGDYAADRRVDIILRSAPARSNQTLPPMMITGENRGPLTNKLLFRGWGGAGLPTPIPLVGVDILELEIKNPNTGASAFYQYTGGNIGWGIPISISRPVTDYEPRDVPFGFVDVDDFEGPGSITSAMAVVGSQALVFSGPKLVNSKKVLRKEGVEFVFTGWDLQIGASAGAGYWKRMPYKTEAERAAYIAKIQDDLDRKRDRTPTHGPKL